MTPTMKLRMLKVASVPRGKPFSTDNYGNYYVWQQWWEGGMIGIKHPGIEQFPYEIQGEWRDIEIEEEKS